MTPLLSAEGVSAGYGDVQIIHDISLTVDAGEILTIIGPNGAGKSTLLKAIFGMLPLMRGRVHFRDRDVSKLRAAAMVRVGAGFVPQTENVFATLSVRENLEMGGYARRSGLGARVREVLDRFPVLTDRLTQQAGRLSGGQRQQLALARALMLDPVLLLLDEPTASLSPVMRQDVLGMVRAIRDTDVAVVMVEQNAKEALAMSDRGLVLVSGRFVLEQTGQEMLANTDVARLFLGQDGEDGAAPANDAGSASASAGEQDEAR